MFRLKVSHLQDLTTFPLPDALPTLGSRSIEQCQYPAEGTHIHAVEQVRTQGMKKQQNTSQQQKLQGNFTRQYRETIERPIPVEKNNYLYQIEKSRRTPTSAITGQRNSQLNIRRASTHR